MPGMTIRMKPITIRTVEMIASHSSEPRRWRANANDWRQSVARPEIRVEQQLERGAVREQLAEQPEQRDEQQRDRPARSRRAVGRERVQLAVLHEHVARQRQAAHDHVDDVDRNDDDRDDLPQRHRVRSVELQRDVERLADAERSQALRRSPAGPPPPAVANPPLSLPLPLARTITAAEGGACYSWGPVALDYSPYERPITSSMISSVPAPIRFSRRSRHERSIPYSFI